MGIAPGNVVCVLLVIACLVFHTILFTDLSDRLETALKRIDNLEMLLRDKNITSKDHKDKTITSHCNEELKMRLDSELENLNTANDSRNVPRLRKKIRRLEKRVEKYIVHSLRRKRNLNQRSKSPCDGTSAAALYTIWGVTTCPAQSKIVDKGQMVTTDGSDYFCLSDQADLEGRPERPTKTPGRNLGSSVSLRGVIYGDIEDIVSFYEPPHSGPKTRNNKTVPCALCARCGKSSSKMIAAIPKSIRKFKMQREYFGTLMSAKESKKLICITVDARSYKNEILPPKLPLRNTVKIHPVELRCNSMYCKGNKYYEESHRVKCMVVTF